ncbi:MAG: 30S ribosomal protein S20 [Chloroflexota bacterium]|nr:30S ribosomal protein S20 [Chloroflexota bacterium]
MANKQAAQKYLRASQRRRMRNKPVRTRARTAVRDAMLAIDASDWSDADQLVQDAVAALDRAAQRGVVHANNAARRKSRLLRHYHHAQAPDVRARPRVRPPEPVQVP